MCISIPGKVITIKGKIAKIKQGDHSHWVDISPLGSKVKEGDYLITYQQAAINKISAKEAEEVLKLMDGTSNAGVKSAN